ncbi:hypothetical protein ACFXTI_022495 [Malus domestica]
MAAPKGKVDPLSCSTSKNPSFSHTCTLQSGFALNPWQPNCNSRTCEVEVFSKLTNAYSLVSIGGFKNFYSTFEAELANVIPVVKTSIGGTRIISRLCAGNKNGLLLLHST